MGHMVAVKDMFTKRFPVIDIGRCSKCLGCNSIDPALFRYNNVIGIMEVVDYEEYPEDVVDEAIKNCPRDCISWDSIDS